MRSETYIFTPVMIDKIRGEALEGKRGYVQGYTDVRGSFIALLIPSPEDRIDNFIHHIKNGY